MPASLINDARFGVRMLAKRPLLTAIAVACLAVGIGANTAIFSVVHRMLVRPLPYGDADRLVVVHTEFPGAGLPRNRVSEPEVADLRDHLSELARFSSYASIDGNVSLYPDAPPERIVTVVADWNTFDTLGVEPALGRDFEAADGVPGNEYVVILSWELWQDAYGGDPTVIGKSLDIDTESHEIVGVAPRGFRFPYQPDARLFAPLAIYPKLRLPRGNHYLDVIGRLEPGVSISELRAGMADMTAELRAAHASDYPDDVGFGIAARPLRDDLLGNVRPTLLLLFGAVALVLLIACGNVASLLLARGMARERELALRMAVGAGKARVVRQLLTESLVLSMFGAVGGLLVALWGIDLLVALKPAAVPLLADIQVSWPVLLFALGVSLIAGVLFGALPAMQAARVDLHTVLKDGGNRATLGRRSMRSRAALVAAEIALALVLLIVAGLMTKSLERMKAADLGFRQDQLLTMKMKLPYPKYPESPERIELYERLFRRLEYKSGLPAVGAISDIPLGGSGNSHTCEIEGYLTEAPPEADIRVVNGPYFDVMGIPLLDGRPFDEMEHRGEIRTVIVDEILAQRYWPNERAVGKHIRLSPADGWLTIVGVVGHVKHQGIESNQRPQLYLPYLTNPPLRMTLVVRAPRAAVSTVQQFIQSLDPDVPLYDIKTMDERVGEALAVHRFATHLLDGFAIVALLLAIIGVYAVMSLSVAQRTRELGIRLALGARPAQIIHLILWQGTRIAFVGLAVGLVGALLTSHAISDLLYDVSPTDVFTYAAASLSLISVAIGTCYLAARRAAKADPMVAMREDA